MSAMKVLHVTPAFHPATYWGGATASVHGLCNALAAAGGEVELRVLTTDSAGPKLRERVAVESFPRRFPAGYDVFYCRRLALASVAPGLWARLPSMIRWADVVHLTGVYSPPTIPTLALASALGRPVVWSPRGALQRWHGSSKPGLKALWEATCRPFVSREGTLLHVTSEEESAASRARFPELRAEVIPNGVELPPLPSRRSWRPGGALRLVTISRLHPIKGIENLLRAMPSLPGEVTLTICGTGEPAYVDSLKVLAAGLRLESRVRFAGRVEAAERERMFEDADICVVPSFSENFGMTVVEALATGVPVVAGTGTPWAGLRDRRCGAWVDNDPASLEAAVRTLGGEDLEAAGKRGREWVAADFSWPAIGRRMKKVYEMLLGCGGGFDEAGRA